MTEHERIWLEPAGAPDRCWCQDNQWGDEGVEYVLASTLESLQRENETIDALECALQAAVARAEAAEAENEELREKAALHSADAKTAWAESDALRKRLDIGPHGEDAVDVAESAADHLRHRAEAAEAEVKRLKQDRYDLAYAITGGEDAPGLLDSVPTSHLVDIARDTHRSHGTDIERAMAAEDKVEDLRQYLLSDEAIEVVAEAIWSIRRIEEDRCDMSLEDIGGQESSVWHEAESALQALASTGGEHHGN